jgi:hypothetical protein
MTRSTLKPLAERMRWCSDPLTFDGGKLSMTIESVDGNYDGYRDGTGSVTSSSVDGQPVWTS